MNWEIVKIEPKSKGRNLPFASVGNGRVELSAAACDLIDNYEKYQYVQLLKAKDKGELVVGVKFLYEDGDQTIKLGVKKMKGKEIKSRTIASKSVVGELFGINGTQKKMTRYNVEKDKDAKDILIIRGQ